MFAKRWVAIKGVIGASVQRKTLKRTMFLFERDLGFCRYSATEMIRSFGLSPRLTGRSPQFFSRRIINLSDDHHTYVYRMRCRAKLSLAFSLGMVRNPSIWTFPCETLDRPFFLELPNDTSPSCSR